MNVANFLKTANQSLANVSKTPRLDAEIFLMAVLDCDRARLFSHPERILSEVELAALQALINRRLNGEPVAYIQGHKGFWNITLAVDDTTLIPRPETEYLVEYILNHYSNDAQKTVLDLGTGSGCIVLALAGERPHWQFQAVDNSQGALRVASKNAASLGLDKVKFIHSNWFDKLAKDSLYDIIVANPPYVSSDAPELEFLRYEPNTALIANNAGFDDLFYILKEARKFIIPGGIILLEHGEAQQEILANFAQGIGYDSIQLMQDYAGKPRFLCAKCT